MSDANRTKISIVEETTEGTTPSNPIWEELRVTGTDLEDGTDYKISDQLRADRQVAGYIRVGRNSGGGLPVEMDYDNLRTVMEGVMQNRWVYAPVRFNNGTADSIITDVTATDVTILANASTKTNYGVFAVGHLVRTTGFTNAGNNGLRRATAGTTATVIKLSGGTIEAAPPGTARAKAVGFEGASGDITATASGLASTALDFTTLGLAAGMWIKVGGSAAGEKFATAANNDWIRITAVAAQALTCDNLPTGWSVDAGAAKTIRVWFGDYIRNGTTKIAYSIEEQLQDLTVPEYDVYTGQVPNLELSGASQDILKGKLTFVGRDMTNSTARTAGSTDVAAPTGEIMNTSSNVARIAEGGSAITGPNFITDFSLSIDNSLERRKAVGSLAAVGMRRGRFMVTGSFSMYYGSNAIRTKILGGTSTSFNQRFVDPIGTRAWVIDLPQVTLKKGTPKSPGVDTDRTMTVEVGASVHATFGYTMHVQRVEEFAS